jgi:hypothetical protein
MESLIYVIINLLNGKPRWAQAPRGLKREETINYFKQMRLLKKITEYGDNIPGRIFRFYISQ